MTGKDMLKFLRQTEDFTMKNLPFLKTMYETFENFEQK